MITIKKESVDEDAELIFIHERDPDYDLDDEAEGEEEEDAKNFDDDTLSPEKNDYEKNDETSCSKIKIGTKILKAFNGIEYEGEVIRLPSDKSDYYKVIYTADDDCEDMSDNEVHRAAASYKNQIQKKKEKMNLQSTSSLCSPVVNKRKDSEDTEILLTFTPFNDQHQTQVADTNNTTMTEASEQEQQHHQVTQEEKRTEDTSLSLFEKRMDKLEKKFKASKKNKNEKLKKLEKEIEDLKAERVHDKAKRKKDKKKLKEMKKKMEKQNEKLIAIELELKNKKESLTMIKPDVKDSTTTISPAGYFFEEVRQEKIHNDSIKHVMLCNIEGDEVLITAVKAGPIIVTRMKDKKELAVLNQSSEIRHLALTKLEGTHVLASVESEECKTISFTCLKTFNLITKHQYPTKIFDMAAYDYKGKSKLAIAQQNGTISLWSMEGKCNTSTLSGKHRDIIALEEFAYGSTDKHYLAALSSVSKCVDVWRIESGTENVLKVTLFVPAKKVTCLCVTTGVDFDETVIHVGGANSDNGEGSIWSFKMGNHKLINTLCHSHLSIPENIRSFVTHEASMIMTYPHGWYKKRIHSWDVSKKSTLTHTIETKNMITSSCVYQGDSVGKGSISILLGDMKGNVVIWRSQISKKTKRKSKEKTPETKKAKKPRLR